MSAKSENMSYETIVNEALRRMKDVTAASSSYEVDRSRGQWSIRRVSSATGAGPSTDIVAAVLTGVNER